MSVGSPSTSGITTTPVSNPDNPSASFGNNSSAAPMIKNGLLCSTEQRVTPIGETVSGFRATS